ncbi:DMT family transporter [Novosphingobium rosa]|uniref:DMT family transporter n=1 Tax=Novosphingobium rosa TaxID=76978 RepID=UPI00083696AC|nr:DMT family transporter [Novosphingobium rosa]
MPVHQRPFLALGLRLAAALAMSSLYMLVKLVHQMGVSLPEIMFWRQAGALPLLALWVALRGQWWQLKTTRLKSHGTRSLMGMVGMLANFGATILLPLAVATILGFTTPMFAVVLSALFLKEKPGRWRWLAVALGFAGVLVIARPGAMPISPIGALVGLCSGFMVAVVSIQLRDMGRTETPLSVVFYFSLAGTLLMLPTLPFTMTHHTPLQWAMILAMGSIGTLAQLLLTAALRYGPVSTVVVMDYSSLIWTTLYGWLVFHQMPPASTWLGAPLVVAAGLVIVWRERVRARAAVMPPE